MAGSGTGPSRRSHTKSRKGCKTCKRRHIRCDETFPQCRNCTKHQVRCDYMESVGSDAESPSSPEQASLALTPMTETSIDLWQQTGSFPFPALHVFPVPPAHEYSRNELRLIHHICTVSNDLVVGGTANFTTWAHKVPKFLSIAASYPYVMHALLSFSASHLRWNQASHETKSLQAEHATVALRGLHEAIGSFSHANADAVLAASLLLLWQAHDWRSWSSLRAGIHSVVVAMQSWEHDSIFAQYIHEEGLLLDTPTNRYMATPGSDERYTTLATTFHALQQLQTMLVGHEAELYWVGELLNYVQRLQSLHPAQSMDEQFDRLYLLRKWLFFVPTLLLERQNGQGPAMLTTAHLYATALATASLYPELGSSFCGRIALAPLEVIVDVMEATQSQFAIDQNSVEIMSLMRFPHQTAMTSRVSMMDAPRGAVRQDSSVFNVNLEPLSYSGIGNLSPAFAPAALHSRVSSSASTYLEVPASQPGFTYVTEGWGAVPSPGFPPLEYTAAAQDTEQLYSYSLTDFRSGFVPPVPIWT